MTDLLTMRDFGKTYRAADGKAVKALQDVNLTVVDGEIVALIGPSGCGKSTLLRAVAGLDDGYTGKLEWVIPPKIGRDIGFVFQEPALLPWRTVERNVSLGLEGKGISKREIDDRISFLLGMMALFDFRKSYPAELSGGMKQRVGIMRALAYDPRVLLMDEPFGALDAITRDKLQDDLLGIWERTRKTILLVTHSVEEAAYLADRVVVFSPRPGRVKAIHEVPLPRDRDASVRNRPEFAAFTGMLRGELE